MPSPRDDCLFCSIVREGTYVRKDADPGVYLVSNALADDLGKLVTDPPHPPSPTPLPSPSPEASPSPSP